MTPKPCQQFELALALWGSKVDLSARQSKQLADQRQMYSRDGLRLSAWSLQYARSSSSPWLLMMLSTAWTSSGASMEPCPQPR